MLRPRSSCLACIALEVRFRYALMSWGSCFEKQAAAAHASLSGILHAGHARLAGVDGLFVASEQGVALVDGRACTGEL